MTDLSTKTTEEIRQWYEERAHLHHEVYKPPHAQRRMETIKGLLAGQVEGETMLDVGCGLGHYAVHAMECNATSVLAIDISPKTIDMAIPCAGVTYQAAAIEDFTPPKVGVALCSETLEHLRDPQAAVRKLEACADTIIASVPVSEARDNIGWGKQGHLHTFRQDTFTELFADVEEWAADGIYCYVVAHGY